jgi:hypothetical protein
MRNSITKHKSRSLITIGIALFALAVLPLLSSARTPTSTSITIVNNSNWQIRHLYLAPADSATWGPDQLTDVTIVAGSSYTLSDVACDQANIKVITEDQDGCFLNKTLACGGSATWTITNDAVPNCGN